MFVIYAVFSEFVTITSCYAYVVNRIVLILHVILLQERKKVMDEARKELPYTFPGFYFVQNVKNKFIIFIQRLPGMLIT